MALIRWSRLQLMTLGQLLKIIWLYLIIETSKSAQYVTTYISNQGYTQLGYTLYMPNAYL